MLLDPIDGAVSCLPGQLMAAKMNPGHNSVHVDPKLAAPVSHDLIPQTLESWQTCARDDFEIAFAVWYH